jgi:hypothetical protein
MTHGVRIAADLRAAIREGVSLFERASEDQTARRPRGDAWSPREIVGHLIDSACNNHRRFVVNQDADRLLIDRYEQNAWVSRQRYAETSASTLIPFWAAYNDHIARVLEAIPDEVLDRPRGPLGGHRFSYAAPPATEFATLRYVAEDYVAHLRHHLEQIRRLLRSA